MKIVKTVKGLFGKKVEIEVTSMHSLVEKLKWADGEVSDTKDALLGLQMRLQHGVSTMEEIAEDADSIIKTHQEVLAKAVARKNEFHGHVAQVTQAINVVNNIYKD
jgi:hypothetical protein